MGKRATRKAKAGDGIRDLEVDALKAENLHLKEEIERLRLRNAGAHPAAALADALQSSDDAGDSADDALTMYASSMVIRSELIELLDLFKTTIQDYERRLEILTESPTMSIAETADDAAAEAEADEETEDELELTGDGAGDDSADESDEDIEELVAEADDASDQDREEDAEDDDEPGAVTIDLRDKEREKDKAKAKAVNGSRRNGSNNRGRGRQRDENAAPAAKGA